MCSFMWYWQLRNLKMNGVGARSCDATREALAVHDDGRGERRRQTLRLEAGRSGEDKEGVRNDETALEENWCF